MKLSTWLGLGVVGVALYCVVVKMKEGLENSGFRNRPVDPTRPPEILTPPVAFSSWVPPVATPAPTPYPSTPPATPMPYHDFGWDCNPPGFMLRPVGGPEQDMQKPPREEPIMLPVWHPSVPTMQQYDWNAASGGLVQPLQIPNDYASDTWVPRGFTPTHGPLGPQWAAPEGWVWMSDFMGRFTHLARVGSPASEVMS